MAHSTPPEEPLSPSEVAPKELTAKSEDRRRFLRTSIGAAAGAVLATSCSKESSAPSAGLADGLPEGLDGNDFLVHGTNPWCMESKRGRLDGLITPTDQVFVRANLPAPDKGVLAARGAWTLNVAGVKNPRALTLAELQGMGRQTVASVLQCSGNGRKFFTHGASGSPWGVGAAANVLWTGVPLRTVVEALGGLIPGQKFLTATGGESIAEGLDAKKLMVERSIPIEKAMTDGLLAWQMNSEPLTMAHGGPLRFVVPGYYGVNNVKYVKEIAATAEESTAKIQVSSYRVRPVGESGSPEQPSMWAMNTKSWITAPLGGEGPVKAGETMITGVAFSGEAPVDSVEVSVDGGATWSNADLVGPDLGPFAWRLFAMPWKAGAGKHTLVCRAKDQAGTVQPENAVPNERGYAHNGWRDHGVDVQVG